MASTKSAGKMGNGKRKVGMGTIKTKSHPVGRSARVGHEHRLDAFQQRALQLNREGLNYWEIGERIADEFDLVSIPSTPTICVWINKRAEVVKADIGDLQWNLRVRQSDDLDKLKAKWMPLAIAQHLEITRWVRVEGAKMPELDENAIAEQLEAAKIVVKCMERQSKLLGLDVEKAPPTSGEGPSSHQDLMLWIISQSSTQSAPGAVVEIKSEILELRSGIPESEADSV